MYKLYGIFDWGSLAVHMALEEIGAPFEFVSVDPSAGDLTRPAYLAMNPFGKLPVLQTPDGPLFETMAILLYLADRHASLALGLGLAPAPNTPDRGTFLVWLSVVCQQLHPAVLQILHPYRLLGEAAQSDVADATHAQLLTICAHLNAQAAQGAWWLSGAQPSIISLYAAMLLRWAQALALFPKHALRLADFPALHAMVRAVEARPAVARVLAREGLYARGPHPLSAPPYEG